MALLGHSSYQELRDEPMRCYGVGVYKMYNDVRVVAVAASLRERRKYSIELVEGIVSLNRIFENRARYRDKTCLQNIYT